MRTHNCASGREKGGTGEGGRGSGGEERGGGGEGAGGGQRGGGEGGRGVEVWRGRGREEGRGHFLICDFLMVSPLFWF